MFAVMRPAAGHAPPTPIPVPPLRVKANQLVDSAGAVFVLRGVSMPGLEAISPTATDLANVRAMSGFTFRVMRQRWNMNAVRLPVSAAVWKRDGQGYLDRVAAVVALANAESLVVVLAAQENGSLPSSTMVDFWKAWAGAFAKTPGVIFALFNEPSTRDIPGSNPLNSPLNNPVTHRAADWQLWRNGGALAGGAASVGMQDLVNAIRGTGAQQIIAAAGFQDTAGFQGFAAEAYLADANVMYEWHPYFDVAMTDTDRAANFGFLAGTFPLYAGAWGMPFGHATAACTAIPRGESPAGDLLLGAMAYFDFRNVSWTVTDFAPGSLIQNFTDYTATLLGPWTCDATSDPRWGIGQFVLLWMTDDPAGFGSLAVNQIASLAGGIPAPVAPGEIISLYGQGIGPATVVAGQLDSNGRVATTLAETQVLFDGRPAPVLLAWAFQVNVQVPYEVAGRKATSVQLLYRGVPSNTVDLAVVDAAPGLLTLLGTSQAAVLNQDGSVNDATNAAARGSVISFFAVGAGVMKGGAATGAAAGSPLGVPALPVVLKMANVAAEVLYAGEAPGLVGCLQVNARIPADFPAGDRGSVALSVGGAESRVGVTFWVK
jgi:uncharacterized protein (TIGR03437 family)